MAAQVQQKRDFAGYRLRAVPPNTRESPSRRQRPLPPCVENRCFEDLAGSDEDVADIVSEASEYLRITESRGTVASADQRFSMFCFLQNFIIKTTFSGRLRSRSGRGCLVFWNRDFH